MRHIGGETASCKVKGEDEMEDYAIVALYWNRDENAIAETDRKYHGYCWSIAWNILSSREDAEECVSDTWHNAWNAMPPQKPNSLSAFLGRIVRNLSLSRWRRDHARKRYGGMDALLSELEDCLPAPGAVEELLEQRELTELLERWLERLDKEDRVLFLRRYWYGDAVRDLAGQWGVSPNRMTKRLLRLRGELKAVLEQGGVAV